MVPGMEPLQWPPRLQAVSLLLCAACTGASGGALPDRPLFTEGDAPAFQVPPATPLPELPCARAAPADTLALLDDLEDGDGEAVRTPAREAYWFAGNDGSAGTQLPVPGAILPDEEPSRQTNHALHFQVEGFEDWGASFGLTLRYHRDGTSCPYNAMRFHGLRFRARGTGSLEVRLAQPHTTPPEFGGTCKEACFDDYVRHIQLHEGWHTYVLAWDAFAQEGFGEQAPLDPTRILSVAFQSPPEDQPVEGWLDDIAWVDAPAQGLLVTPEQAAPPAGTP
jgi:hypothetical protein